MDSMSFATKYRPNSLDDYLGDERIAAVKNIMSGDPVTWPHVWLFYGERGTGKTTIARILSKWYLCLEPTKDGPCCKCDICKELDETLVYAPAGAEAYCVTEIDIANDSGKAKIMQALEDALIPPQYPMRFKVLILDECHMATNQAQNALLKICEEPPSHLVLMFCTTNPERMLSTLYDRCVYKIRAKKATPDSLVKRLQMVCEKENIETSVKALTTLVRKSQSNPRTCLMNLESISKICGNKCTLQDVLKHTEGDKSVMYSEYVKSAQDGLGSLMAYVHKLQQDNVDLYTFLTGMPEYILNAVKVRYGIGIDEYAPEFVKSVNSLFKDYRGSELDVLLQVMEYTMSYLDKPNMDVNKLELLITTVGIRISKLRLLAQGLHNEQIVGQNENRLGSREAVRIMEEDYAASRPKQVAEAVSNELLISTFGKQVTEIAAGANNSLGEMIDNMEDLDDEDDDAFASEEDFLRELERAGF